MDEYISKKELDKVLEEQATNRRGDSDWRGRMKRVRAGESLVLYPRDNTNLYNLRITAIEAAKREGITIKTRKWDDNGKLKLFIFLA